MVRIRLPPAESQANSLARQRLRLPVGAEVMRARCEQRAVEVLLENLNKEPDEADIHYLAHTIEEWRYYFDAIQSPAFKLSFTVNHAHLSFPKELAALSTPSIWDGSKR